jgi:parvulin-like peptidyl-prolyl isomerase
MNLRVHYLPRIVATCFAVMLPAALVAQEKLSPKKTARPRIAATVGDAAIYDSEVQAKLDRGLKRRVIDDDARPALAAHALAQLVNQRLVMAYLHQRGTAAHRQEIKAELDIIRRKLKTQNITLAEFLKRSGQTAARFEYDLAWRITWNAYQERNINDTTLERYFNAHRRQFDGTQLRVSQILFKRGAGGTEKLLKQAESIRSQITAGKISFAEAAKKHSAAPSGKRGGDVGFIDRHGSMGEPFCKAGFGLKKGETSEPVITDFGVHLIQTTDSRPGKRRWQDVRKELRSEMVRFLFGWVADRQRDKITVKFSGASPYFSPDTGKLVVPSKQP